jgi:zinc transport system substrate-binding protein
MKVENKMKGNNVIVQFFSFKGWIIPALMVVLFSCNQSKPEHGKQVITVSILPQKFFVEKIAGDKFEVNVMVPPGASHENYDPTPGQIVGLSNSKLYFRIGNIEFENTWMDKFRENYPNLKIIDLSKNIDLIENSDHHHNHGLIEPHTWMSPLNVKVMSKMIYEVLAGMDNMNENYYSVNYHQFLKEIDALNERVKEKLLHAHSKGFIIYHPALTYYARDYGLKQFSIEVEGKNPSAFHIRSLIDIAKKEKIRIVFVQKQFDRSRAETIAKEIDGIIIDIDPLAYEWDIQMMEITEKLVEVYEY